MGREPDGGVEQGFEGGTKGESAGDDDTDGTGDDGDECSAEGSDDGLEAGADEDAQGTTRGLGVEAVVGDDDLQEEGAAEEECAEAGGFEPCNAQDADTQGGEGDEGDGGDEEEGGDAEEGEEAGGEGVAEGSGEVGGGVACRDEGDGGEQREAEQQEADGFSGTLAPLRAGGEARFWLGVAVGGGAAARGEAGDVVVGVFVGSVAWAARGDALHGFCARGAGLAGVWCGGHFDGAGFGSGGFAQRGFDGACRADHRVADTAEERAEGRVAKAMVGFGRAKEPAHDGAFTSEPCGTVGVWATPGVAKRTRTTARVAAFCAAIVF